MKELVLLSIVSCTAEIVLSVPLTHGIWQVFRLLIVDTEEMRLILNPQALLIPLIFAVVMIVMLFVLAYRSILRINIMDIIHERHKAEPIHAVSGWYGIGGIVLMIADALP